jgi:hypothetical protein
MGVHGLRTFLGGGDGGTRVVDVSGAAERLRARGRRLQVLVDGPSFAFALVREALGRGEELTTRPLPNLGGGDYQALDAVVSEVVSRLDAANVGLVVVRDGPGVLGGVEGEEGKVLRVRGRTLEMRKQEMLARQESLSALVRGQTTAVPAVLVERADPAPMSFVQVRATLERLGVAVIDAPGEADVELRRCCGALGVHSGAGGTWDPHRAVS